MPNRVITEWENQDGQTVREYEKNGILINSDQIMDAFSVLGKEWKIKRIRRSGYRKWYSYWHRNHNFTHIEEVKIMTTEIKKRGRKSLHTIDELRAISDKFKESGQKWSKFAKTLEKAPSVKAALIKNGLLEQKKRS